MVCDPHTLLMRCTYWTPLPYNNTPAGGWCAAGWVVLDLVLPRLFWNRKQYGCNKMLLCLNSRKKCQRRTKKCVQHRLVLQFLGLVRHSLFDVSHSVTSILPGGGQTNTWKCNLFYKSPRAESTVHNTAFMVYIHFQLQVMCPLQVWSSGWRHDGASNFHVGEEKTWKKPPDFWLETGNKQARH